MLVGDLLRNLKLLNVMKLLQMLKRYQNFIFGTCLISNLLTKEANYEGKKSDQKYGYLRLFLKFLNCCACPEYNICHSITRC